MTRLGCLPVPGYPGYEADAEGVLYGKLGRPIGSVTPKGYVQASLIIGNPPKQVCRKVHCLVLETFVGPCPPGMEASHLNNVRSDNRLENLVWETHAENVRRKIEHGTRQRGETHNMAKLTEADVVELRRLRREGAKFSELAARYDMTDTAVRYVVSGHVWGHVPGAVPKPGQPVGTARGHAKLTDGVVRKLREDRERLGLSYSKLGSRYGISPSAARSVVVRETWKHVLS